MLSFVLGLCTGFYAKDAVKIYNGAKKLYGKVDKVITMSIDKSLDVTDKVSNKFSKRK